ncbi:MAG: response regulator transcription factor [Bacteroidota bacterium]
MINVQIADDHQMFREGIVALLQGVEGIRVSGQASNGVELLELVKVDVPDVLLLDIEMPEMDGFETLKELKKLKVPTKVLVLTMHKSSAYVQNIIKSGAHGYLQKDSGKEALITAITQVMETGSYFTSETADLLVKSFQQHTTESPISPRETEVVALIVEGFTTKEIAQALFLSRHTVESHRQNILLKLGLKNSAELVKYAIQKGLV